MLGCLPALLYCLVGFLPAVDGRVSFAWRCGVWVTMLNVRCALLLFHRFLGLYIEVAMQFYSCRHREKNIRRKGVFWRGGGGGVAFPPCATPGLEVDELFKELIDDTGLSYMSLESIEESTTVHVFLFLSFFVRV